MSDQRLSEPCTAIIAFGGIQCLRTRPCPQHDQKLRTLLDLGMLSEEQVQRLMGVERHSEEKT